MFMESRQLTAKSPRRQEKKILNCNDADGPGSTQMHHDHEFKSLASWRPLRVVLPDHPVFAEAEVDC